MFRSLIVPLLIGIAGAAVLVSLGVWQLQRLDWKEGVLAEIGARIGAEPVALPTAPAAGRDQYLPVRIEGAFTGEAVRALVSVKGVGPGYRVISAFRTGDGRRVMVDEGFVRDGGNVAPGAAEGVTVTGNLHWPDETDRWTPEPDLSDGLFFARDVGLMAEALGTEPVFVVARAVEGIAPRAGPIPVGIEGIPNDHLGYAVQWFGLAAVWVGMTALLLWRIRRRTV